MKKVSITTGVDQGRHYHGRKEHLDEKKKKKLNGSSNSGSETDDQSLITHAPSRQSNSRPGAASDEGDEAIPEVNFSPAEMEHIQSPYHLSVFVKVSGLTVGKRQMFFHLRRIWNPKGSLHLITLKNDYYLVKFSDVSDYHKACYEGPWMIDNHYITLQPWSPNFKPSEEIISRIAAWVRLPELPVEYFNIKALRKIAQVIGVRLVKIHPVTRKGETCKFARICVEFDLQEPLHSYVKLPNELRQPIQYEGQLHELCRQCRRVGHLQENCLYRASDSTEQSASPDPSLDHCFAYGPGPLRNTHRLPHQLQVWSSTFQVPAGGNPSDWGWGANLQIGECSSSSTLRNIKTEEQNKHVPTPSTQAQTTEEVTTGDKDNASLQPVVSTTTTIPSVTGHQSASSSRMEMLSQAMQKSLVRRQINRAPVEIKERSNQGLPTVFDIDSNVSELAIDVKMSSLPSANVKLQQITINPTSNDQTENATPTSSTKNFFLWNCQGASNPRKFRAISDLCKAHKPSILLLLETRTSGKDADRLIKDLGFSGKHFIDSEGYTGGVWLLWRIEHIQVNVAPGTSDHIHAVARFSPMEGHKPRVE